MEDTLRGVGYKEEEGIRSVLILVLMEDTLRVVKDNAQVYNNSSLNPCFNGRYSQRAMAMSL